MHAMPKQLRAMRRASSGQIVVIFALMLTVLMGMVGIAVDVTHARSVAEDVQRAADAAALAGVIYLPNNDDDDAQTQAAVLARANGFADDGGRTTTITYTPDTLHRTLTVTITYKVPTSF